MLLNLSDLLILEHVILHVLEAGPIFLNLLLELEVLFLDLAKVDLLLL